ncbi:MAG: magnesium chelatase [Phycisphaerae bacterium]|nr:magnesium chelatase [Phycisphaerae bacterium]
MSQAATLGELRRTGYQARSVKDEMRENLIRKLRAGEPVLPGIVGYDDTVVPQITHAVLSRHDMLLLGLRGQAKTRILRLLPSLLDEFIPVVAGTELPDDPIEPRFRQTRAIIAEHGDRTPIRWMHRDERFHEKLATPDVTIADLLGEIDLVKHAEGRYLADESIMHFGLVPRSNRGIFGLNELPDLAPRIQVGLFNVLEERDVQIRGFPVRMPLDLCMVFTANPEDYTNRGRIVTPLKDRIGAVIRTHYPLRGEDALEITRQNAWLERPGDGAVEIPRFMHEIIEEMVRQARSSAHINQQSGVSVRASITCVETMVSSAERRAILLGEAKIVPRMCDLNHIAASCRGKLELMLADDERTEDKLITALLGEAVKAVFDRYAEVGEFAFVPEHFHQRKAHLEVGDDVPASAIIASAEGVPGLRPGAGKLCESMDVSAEDPFALASVIELILEALFVNNRLSKYAYRGRTVYKR